jgi:hypothetical protein
VQLKDISYDGSFKDMFDADELHFWLLVKNDYPSLSDKAIKVLLHFVTTYLYETAFSSLSLKNIDPG